MLIFRSSNLGLICLLILSTVISCEDDPALQQSLTFDEASQEIENHPKCGSSSAPTCSNGAKCYGLPLGDVCIQKESMACKLFGCAGNFCTIEESPVSSSSGASWSEFVVTSCLEKIPSGDNDMCTKHANFIITKSPCEDPDVVLDAFGCSLCLPREQACELMGCSTSRCEISLWEWDGCADPPPEGDCSEPTSGHFYKFNSCFEKELEWKR